MNKYQEALNHLHERSGYYLSDYLVGKEETEAEEDKNSEAIKAIQELVDRATPMKAIHIPGIASGEDFNRWKCPNNACGHKTRRNIREPKIGWCDRCGQATDYTEEE